MHAGEIGAAISDRDRARDHQKPSSNTMNQMRMDGLRTEFERDSGFSDASSEHLSAQDQTDSDETTRGAYPGAQASQLVMGAPYSGLSPMFFMNNVLLKQPNETSSSSQKPWGFRPAIGALPQPQVVFLQPMVSADPSLQRSASTKRRRSKKYLPILKSYPRIAPYPGDSSSEKGSSGSSERSSSASGQWGRRRGRKQESCPVGLVPPTPTATPAASIPRASSPAQPPPLHEADADGCTVQSVLEQLAPPSESGLSASPAEPNSVAGVPDPSAWLAGAGPAEDPADEDCDSKRKRFCNTYNILSQSGLLDVTLRVQELLRQNRHSQSQLERLQGQASLFLEAVQSGSPEVWARLQKTMLEAAADAHAATEEGNRHVPVSERLP